VIEIEFQPLGVLFPADDTPLVAAAGVTGIEGLQ